MTVNRKSRNKLIRGSHVEPKKSRKCGKQKLDTEFGVVRGIDLKNVHVGFLYGGNNTLFESTGFNGHSSVREVALQTGNVKAIQKMDYSYFREGLTLLSERYCRILLAWIPY